MVTKMKENIEFLNYIYQNAQMGVVGIDDIINKITDEDFENVIKEQKDDYETICKETSAIFKKYGKEEKELPMMAKVGSYMMSEMKTLTDSSTNMLAKMMIEGSNKGIIEITEQLNNYSGDDEEIRTLANKLLKIEQKNLDNLKKFL